MVVSVQIAPPDFDRVFAALAHHTRRDIVRRAISAEEGTLELASHYPMSFAAVQKHVAVLERAGLITTQRIGRRRAGRPPLLPPPNTTPRRAVASSPTCPAPQATSRTATGTSSRSSRRIAFSSAPALPTRTARPTRTCR